MWNNTKNQAKEIDGIKEDNIMINATLEKQAERITELMAIKEIMDTLEHISEVDTIWQDVQTANNTINSLDKSVEQLVGKLDEQVKHIVSNHKTISKIEAQKYIYDVDETKVLVDELVQEMNSTIKNITLMEQNIDSIIIRLEKIESISHLTDVDFMYDEIQKLNETINSLNDAKEFMIVENSKLSNHLEEIEKDFAKKLKIAYAIACGSVGLAVIEFVLAIMGLI